MSDESRASEAEPYAGSESKRVEAFSDGVLAVAITLLVLDLKLPYLGTSGLWPTLTSQWPTFAAYATSFLVIGIMWVNHHGIFKQIKYVDRPLMLLNLLLLMFIVTIPFATSLVSHYLRAAGSNGNVAMAVYSGVSLCVALTFSALWGYALRHPALLEPSVDVQISRKAFPRFAGGGLFYAVLIGISLYNAVIALIVTFLLALYYAFDQIPSSRRS